MMDDKKQVEQRKTSWSAPTGRRTDEWSECLVLIGKTNDRAAFSPDFFAILAR